jgi:hypothetical protein
VVLLDAVGFSTQMPLDQMATLNSLSYSVNSAYAQLLSKNINIDFARTTTGAASAGGSCCGSSGIASGEETVCACGGADVVCAGFAAASGLSSALAAAADTGGCALPAGAPR